MPYPLIGISGSQVFQSSEFDGVAIAYTPQFFVDGLHEAHASPLMLPVGKKEHARNYVNAIDGLVLTGGHDVSPHLYGEDPHPKLQATFPERDLFDLALMEAALEKKIPILAICRGMQLVNVYYGGSLYQDLPSQYGETMIQHVQKSAFRFPIHTVQVVEDSYLHTLTGDQALVNSFHHQGIKRVGDGLRVVATSSDGMVEAIEAEDPSVDLLGLQWHPEIMFSDDKISLSVFEDFVLKCQKS